VRRYASSRWFATTYRVTSEFAANDTGTKVSSPSVR
jgi:hypothetical protein